MDIFADIAPLTGEEGIRDDIVLKKVFFQINATVKIKVYVSALFLDVIKLKLNWMYHDR
jgi:hypothetical protein